MAYPDEVREWTATQPADQICRGLGIYPEQLQAMLQLPDGPDPGIVLRLGAIMEHSASGD